MFDVSEKEALDISKELDQIEKIFKSFEQIDTTGVEEMVYPFDNPTVFLREDNDTYVISQDEAMSNVSKTKQGHVVVPKVVK